MEPSAVAYFLKHALSQDCHSRWREDRAEGPDMTGLGIAGTIGARGWPGPSALAAARCRARSWTSSKQAR